MSQYLIAIGVAWFLAQGGKYLIASIKSKQFDNVRQLYSSGSMPSVHSATSVAILTMVTLRDGAQGGLFALSLLFAIVVMYDAIMVRRSSGEQGIAIQRLIKEQKSSIPLPRAAKGHTPLEVVVGALLGFVVAAIVFVVAK